MSIVGDNIKAKRKTMKMSQTALAKAAGISQAAISAIESGAVTRTPYTDTIARIANALGCTVSDLMGDADAKGEPDEVTREYTQEQLHLLSIVQRLNVLGVQKVIEYASDLADNEKYIRETSAASAG